MKNRINLRVVFFVTAAMFAGVAFPFCANAQSKPLLQSARLDTLAYQVLDAVNAHRDSMGLPKMVMNDTIIKAAKEHSANMASGRLPLGHDGFEERVGALMKALKPAHAAAENVADGKLNAKEVVAVWLHSPGHRKNIEGGFNTTGIGIARGKDGVLYFTQIFINRK